MSFVTQCAQELKEETILPIAQSANTCQMIRFDFVQTWHAHAANWGREKSNVLERHSLCITDGHLLKQSKRVLGQHIGSIWYAELCFNIIQSLAVGEYSFNLTAVFHGVGPDWEVAESKGKNYILCKDSEYGIALSRHSAFVGRSR